MLIWDPSKFPVGSVTLNPWHDLHDDINEAWWLGGGGCIGLKRGINGTSPTSGVSRGYQSFGPVHSSAANNDNFTLPSLGLGAWTELSVFTLFRTGASSSGNTWTDIFDISGTGENVGQLAYEFNGPLLRFGWSLGTSDIDSSIVSAYSTNYLLGISTLQSGTQITVVLNLDTGVVSVDSSRSAHTSNSTGSLTNRICGATSNLGFKGSMQFLVLFNRQLSLAELRMLVLGPRYALFAPDKLLRRSGSIIQAATDGINRRHFIGMW